MKTANLSSEKNGISIAFNVGAGKPVYMTPSQFKGLLGKLDTLSAEFGTLDPAELAAIDERASSTPEARALARVTAQRAKLADAVANAAPGTPAREVAELELKVFELKNK